MGNIIKIEASSLEEAKKKLSAEASRLWWKNLNKGQLFHPVRDEVTIKGFWRGVTLVASARDMDNDPRLFVSVEGEQPTRPCNCGDTVGPMAPHEHSPWCG